MNISIFKSLYKTDDVPFELDVLKVLDRIKIGASKEKILKIRTMPESEEKKQLKNSLRYYIIYFPNPLFKIMKLIFHQRILVIYHLQIKM